MEHNEVSAHEVKIFLALGAAHPEWLTNKDIASRLQDVAPRTVRAHTLKLVQLGIVDQAEIFPGHRYRLSDKAEKRNRAYTNRLLQAADILGLRPLERAKL